MSMQITDILTTINKLDYNLNVNLHYDSHKSRPSREEWRTLVLNFES